MTSTIAHAIEILDGGRWVRCETDGAEYRADTREAAEGEARFSLDAGTSWRVVAVADVSPVKRAKGGA